MIPLVNCTTWAPYLYGGPEDGPYLDHLDGRGGAPRGKSLKSGKAARQRRPRRSRASKGGPAPPANDGPQTNGTLSRESATV